MSPDIGKSWHSPGPRGLKVSNPGVGVLCTGPVSFTDNTQLLITRLWLVAKLGLFGPGVSAITAWRLLTRRVNMCLL